jgi:multidrug transporter EmrE-like cation transporter
MKEWVSRFVRILPWLVVLVLVEQLALCSAKAYVSNESNKLWLISAVVSYGMVGYIFTRALMTKDNLGQLNTLWNIFSTVLAFAFGIIIFKERNFTPRILIGVALAVCALALVA